ncbi:MAG: pirin family protein [Nitrospiria bacterium]
MKLSILHRDDLRLGGFAGLREHRLVVDPKVFGPMENPGTWSGIGKFVYLADARFLPHGETRLHHHREVDVISVMVAGRIAHEGSLKHGQILLPFDVQVQRAGGEGFSHNEVNPDDRQNRMIQIWVLPDKPGEPAGYKTHAPKWGEVTRVYGGGTGQTETFASNTFIDIALLKKGQRFKSDRPFMAYLTTGKGAANTFTIQDGDLLRGERLLFEAKEDVQMIIVRTLQSDW